MKSSVDFGLKIISLRARHARTGWREILLVNCPSPLGLWNHRVRAGIARKIRTTKDLEAKSSEHKDLPSRFVFGFGPAAVEASTACAGAMMRRIGNERKVRCHKELW